LLRLPWPRGRTTTRAARAALTRPYATTRVALNLTRDGWKHLRVAVDDLIDQEPTVVDHAAVDPLPRPLDG